ncbi:hypothetical protein BFL35_16430 (plasmid) [Clavibacter michiganensis]|nr:hypothetical protein BFL35_16430 [Clavibacter michiganensis]
MGWLEAVSSWIASLAWPVATVLLVVVMRKPLGVALRSVRRVKAAGVEFDFGTELADVEDAVDALTEGLPAGATDSRPPTNAGEGPTPAGVDPSGVIIRAWERLSDEIVAFADVAKVGLRNDGGRRRNLRTLVHLFQVDDLLDRGATHVIFELYDLRNRVAHGKHVPTPGEALIYEASADDVRGYIRFQREARGSAAAPAPPEH